ncbi:MAG: hypothetical protein J2P50_00090 [Hyphomicrobiaceae bacterium]|nr:hypothetical protein [Hyphomicrobiaceae bacterium]
MQLFGLDLTGELARVLSAVIAGAIAAASFIIGRWSEHRGWVRFRREDLVSSSIVIEMYGIRAEAGRDVLHIISQGSASAMERWFTNPNLVRHVRKEAAKHPGLLRLPSWVAHRMMMDEGKDMITGLDPAANMDFVHGRPTRDDETLFGFAAYAEQDHDGSGLRDEVARLVLMVVSPSLIDKLADPDYVERLGVAHSGYRPRRARLYDFAREWQRLEALPAAQRSSATDKIWQVTVRTSLRYPEAQVAPQAGVAPCSALQALVGVG